MKTQHIFPLCGVTMFETGGGLTLPGQIVFGFFWVSVDLDIAHKHCGISFPRQTPARCVITGAGVQAGAG